MVERGASSDRHSLVEAWIIQGFREPVYTNPEIPLARKQRFPKSWACLSLRPTTD